MATPLPPMPSSTTNKAKAPEVAKIVADFRKNFPSGHKANNLLFWSGMGQLKVESLRDSLFCQVFTLTKTIGSGTCPARGPLDPGNASGKQETVALRKMDEECTLGRGKAHVGKAEQRLRTIRRRQSQSNHEPRWPRKIRFHVESVRKAYPRPKGHRYLRGSPSFWHQPIFYKG